MTEADSSNNSNHSTWLLAAADGTDTAAAQEVMAGWFPAWSPCLRGWGAEELVVDLFPLREVVGAAGLQNGDGDGRAPFGHKVRLWVWGRCADMWTG